VARVDRPTALTGGAALIASLGLAFSQYTEKDAMAEQLAICHEATVKIANKLIDARIRQGATDREIYEEVSPVLTRSSLE
jgi:uncharacterized protein YutE (UPF0331/DUF86 family)